MTMKEAIDTLTLRKDCYDELSEALDMAIAALQREDRFLKSMDTNEPLYTEVVRCKDCKSSRVYDGKTTQWLACEDVMEGQATDPNGYCYLGERKEP